MTTDFRDFARAVDRAAGDLLGEPVLRAKQELAKAALGRVIARTPAVTGHARANWQVTIGGPARSVIDGADPSGAATLADGVAAIMADRDPFATVWITNNAPYIQRVEHGDTERAPAAMVAATAAELGGAK